MTSQEIVERIEEKLAEIGMKKTDFYRLCNVSRASFSQWRSGKVFPEHNNFVAINKVLGLDFAVTESTSQKEIPASHLESGAFAEWSDAWDDATPEGREAALAVLRLSKRPPESQD